MTVRSARPTNVTKESHTLRQLRWGRMPCCDNCHLLIIHHICEMDLLIMPYRRVPIMLCKEGVYPSLHELYLVSFPHEEANPIL